MLCAVTSLCFLLIGFVLNGLHVPHLAACMIVNAYLLGPGDRMWKSDTQRFTNRVEVAWLSWHFVDAIWLVLILVLYLL
jgi:cytochrome c oxidase subunit 3